MTREHQPEELLGAYIPEVVRETEEGGQVIWFKSSPNKKEVAQIEPDDSQDTLRSGDPSFE